MYVINTGTVKVKTFDTIKKVSVPLDVPPAYMVINPFPSRLPILLPSGLVRLVSFNVEVAQVVASLATPTISLPRTSMPIWVGVIVCVFICLLLSVYVSVQMIFKFLRCRGSHLKTLSYRPR